MVITVERTLGNLSLEERKNVKFVSTCPMKGCQKWCYFTTSGKINNPEDKLLNHLQFMHSNDVIAWPYLYHAEFQVPFLRKLSAMICKHNIIKTQLY